jgi:hypothetical protein
MFNKSTFEKINRFVLPIIRAFIVFMIMLFGIAAAFNFLENPNTPWSMLHCLVAMVIFFPAIDYWSRVVKDWLR